MKDDCVGEVEDWPPSRVDVEFHRELGEGGTTRECDVTLREMPPLPPPPPEVFLGIRTKLALCRASRTSNQAFPRSPARISTTLMRALRQARLRVERLGELEEKDELEPPVRAVKPRASTPAIILGDLGVERMSDDASAETTAEGIAKRESVARKASRSVLRPSSPQMIVDS